MTTKYEINTKIQKYKIKGISLLELIIYVSVFSIVALVMVEIFFVSIKGDDLASARFEVNQNLRFAAEKIRQTVFDALAISVSGACPLNILNATSTTGATSSIFIDNGFLKISNGSGINDITTGKVVASSTLSDCLFTIINNPAPAKSTLQAKLKIVYNSQGRSDLDIAESQQITISLR